MAYSLNFRSPLLQELVFILRNNQTTTRSLEFLNLEQRFWPLIPFSSELIKFLYMQNLKKKANSNQHHYSHTLSQKKEKYRGKNKMK